MAKSAYLPSLDLSAGLSGYTRQSGSNSYVLNQATASAAGARAQCEQMNLISSGLKTPLPGFPQTCPAGTLTADQERAILNQNKVFPFNYTTQPLSASVRFSLPIFQGFGRERQVQQAKAASADARYRVRSEELRLKTTIGSAYLNVVTARQSVDLEKRNNELADDQLKLARERYRVGAASFIELRDAETIKARADRAYLIALYAFHENIAALETAVGRNLRNNGQPR
jgi:outer membrane protein